MCKLEATSSTFSGMQCVLHTPQPAKKNRDEVDNLHHLELQWSRDCAFSRFPVALCWCLLPLHIVVVRYSKDPFWVLFLFSFLFNLNALTFSKVIDSDFLADIQPLIFDWCAVSHCLSIMSDVWCLVEAQPVWCNLGCIRTCCSFALLRFGE